MASTMSKRVAALEARRPGRQTEAKARAEAWAILLARAIKWLAIDPPDRPHMPEEITGAVDQLLRECPAMADGI